MPSKVEFLSNGEEEEAEEEEGGGGGDDMMRMMIMIEDISGCREVQQHRQLGQSNNSCTKIKGPDNLTCHHMSIFFQQVIKEM